MPHFTHFPRVNQTWSLPVATLFVRGAQPMVGVAR